MSYLMKLFCKFFSHANLSRDVYRESVNGRKVVTRRMYCERCGETVSKTHDDER